MDRAHEEEIAETIVESGSGGTSLPAKRSNGTRFWQGARAFSPVAVIGIFCLGLLAFLYFGKPFVLPIVLAVLLSFLLMPVVRGLTRLHLPAPIGALLVMAVFVTIVSYGVTRLVQPAAQWAGRAPETLALLQQRFHQWFRRAERLTRPVAVEAVRQELPAKTPIPKVEVGQLNTVFNYTTSFVTELIETLVLLFFMLAAGNRFMQKLVKLLPTLQDKKTAIEIANEVEQSLSTFLFTITLINAVLGLFVGLAAFVVGLPNPVLWGVLAGALNFIPYFGPITGVGVLLLAGVITFESALLAVLPAVIYLALHAVEANLITPMILGRRLTLNPLVIFISLIFWTWLWGIPGALLSIPVLMMLKTFCDHFKSLAPVGEFLSG